MQHRGLPCPSPHVAIRSDEVCAAIVSHERKGKMVGTNGSPIQIDEAKFPDRRKCHGGRMLDGDNIPLSEDSDAEQENNTNHGAELTGLGFLVSNKAQTVGTFLVERRDRNTQSNGSVMHSDEWPAYSNLNGMDYQHSTVVSPTTLYGSSDKGTHSGGSWLDAKTIILKKMRVVVMRYATINSIRSDIWSVLQLLQDVCRCGEGLVNVVCVCLPPRSSSAGHLANLPHYGASSELIDRSSAWLHNVTSNQLSGGAAKGEPGMEASVRDGFSGTLPSDAPCFWVCSEGRKGSNSTSLENSRGIHSTTLCA
ncbi:hypothetical protein E2C01_017069 [Portunus trituberculatus]|uniref:ISXO2-like transposase domain-containing protein n=1 Tax=Portunus trituberculatus TaxID=210409 RepID=A0A5B7DSG3_PORTR|nr:hypothetical protein [Portunus trituberculatus]